MKYCRMVIMLLLSNEKIKDIRLWFIIGVVTLIVVEYLVLSFYFNASLFTRNDRVNKLLAIDNIGLSLTAQGLENCANIIVSERKQDSEKTAELNKQQQYIVTEFDKYAVARSNYLKSIGIYER